ncbi:hypothetical protein J6590_105253 [Homalodisca vitripennis]|nr:hypothetical protein J6590_105253 [Homalodisca vitripennis]
MRSLQYYKHTRESDGGWEGGREEWGGGTEPGKSHEERSHVTNFTTREIKAVSSLYSRETDERERGRERDKDRDRDRDRDRQTHRETDRQTERQTDRQTDRRETDRQTERLTERQTDRQRD